MTISIIIPSRNRNEQLEVLVSQILMSDVDVQEVIVVDQSDMPYAPIAGATIIRSAEVGPAAAKNEGAARASSDIVVFLDDDVVLDTTTIRVLCDPIVSGLCTATTGAIVNDKGVYANQDVESLYSRPYDSWLKMMTANPSVQRTTCTMSFSGGGSAILLEIFRKIGGYDSWFDPDGAGEDRELGVRLYKYGYSVLYVKDAAIRHLALASGGRRDARGMYSVYALDYGMLYICRRHYCDRVYRQYATGWLWSYIWRATVRGPLSVLRVPSRLRRGLAVIKQINAVTPCRFASKDSLDIVGQ